MEINKDLKEYIENEIFPIYEKNDKGHDINHINYVIKRSLEFSKQFDNIDINMVYTIASFHDLAHHIDKDNHEVLSAKMFYENKKMSDFFNDEQRKIIKEAIIDHRSTLEYEPRTIYGKIISSADRNTSLSSSIERSYLYTQKHYPNLSLEEKILRSYNYIKNKFGEDGYAKVYVKDLDFDKFKEEIKNVINDKYEFVKLFLKINKINNIKEQAKFFSINAHKDQVRKSEPDKPYIVHPLGVGKILEEYKCNDNIISAGYLHDVIEDTKYTKDDLKKEFGEDITNLVINSSEMDKSLSWEERKKITIEKTKNLSLDNKLVICADKINNLEDLMILFKKTGKKDFSKFNRDEEKQKWYYENMYNSLINNEDENLPIFKRLKDLLDIIFNDKEDLYLKETIFENNSDYYNKLIKLHYQKLELYKLKEICKLKKPFVIEFSGTPRTGKTSTINNLYDFFKKGGFDISIIEEFTTSKSYKEEYKNKLCNMNKVDLNLYILKCVYKQLEEAIKTNKDIILIDRSINDRQIWNYRRFKTGDIEKNIYEEVRDKYISISKELIDFLVITYADGLTSLKRDYNSSLALEKRNFLNIENIEGFNECLNKLNDLFRKSVDNSLILDTSNINMNEVSTTITENILPVMRKKYIKEINKKYN